MEHKIGAVIFLAVWMFLLVGNWWENRRAREMGKRPRSNIPTYSAGISSAGGGLINKSPSEINKKIIEFSKNRTTEPFKEILDIESDKKEGEEI